MKIVWLINVPTPEASELLGENVTPYGGWLLKTADQLTKDEETELTIIFPYDKVNAYSKIEGERVTYYAIPPISEKNATIKENINVLKDILNIAQPDLVHIHGTEIPHCHTMSIACKDLNIKTTVSIQGLVSMIAKHTYSNLPLKAIYGFSLRNLILKDNVYGLKRLYTSRGKHEVETIKKTNAIIGRTSWDKASTSHINPRVNYYACDETLRDSFYNFKWDIEECEEHSIFVSQAQNPIKGFHVILEAMPLILKKYPNAKIYVAGSNIIKDDTLVEKIKQPYYGKYIKKLIKDYRLLDKIEFTGPLNEIEMCQQYLKANVFVSASFIENSPNSLGEAMILGVPTVSSYVGGVPDLLRHDEEGYLYQTDAPYMLAYYINKIFDNKRRTVEISENARKRALQTHNPEKNINTLLNIYKTILD